MSSAPNVLLIMSDQHGARWSGCYGHPVVQTPSIDRLAAEGALFENAYCNSPLCVPSRMSFLTGRRVQDIEVWDNNTFLPPGSATWPRALRAAGYDVVLDGKMHICGPDRLQGFQEQLSRDAEDPSARPVPDWDAHTVPGVEFRLFDNGFRAEPEDYRDTDDEVAHAAVRFLESLADRRQGRPWVLVVGFHGPHPKWYVEQRYLDMYPPDTLPVPDFPRSRLREQNPVHLRNRAMRGSPEEGYPLDMVQRARQHYFAKITRVDERIGAVLEALDRSGAAEDTHVIYTSDHGEMAGEHGLWNKHCFYEESAAVPLVLRPARGRDGNCAGTVGGTRRSEVVSLMDLSRTLFNLGAANMSARGSRVEDGVTDTARFEGVPGRDLLALLDGRISGWANRAVSEYYGTWIDRPAAMLRRDQFKLMHSLGDPSELYDLRSDPREINDVSGDSSYRGVLQELEAELLHDWSPEELHRKVVDSQKERRHLWPPPEGSQSNG